MIPFSLGEGHRRFRKSPGRSDREIRTQPWQVRTRREVHLGRGTARGCARVVGWLAVNKQKDPISPKKWGGGCPNAPGEEFVHRLFFCITQKSFHRKYQNASFEEVDRISWSILSDKYDVSEVLDVGET